MDVHKTSLLAVFDAKQRLEVPLFQRQYVWSEEQQWLPLWEDIERKFTEALDGRKDAPVHFLGAMVLDQKQTPTGHVVVRQVIDGQQRLTTLQIFLAAYRDFCSEKECPALAAECSKFLENTGMMADQSVDRFKVWPTQLDRPQFTDVIVSGSRTEVLRRHPLRKKPYARKPDPRPRMVEAYLFFYEQLIGFFSGENGEAPLASEFPLTTRVDECFQTLRNALMVVVIDLQKDDDPQVIFETLNARGQPLLPADLLRNYIFFRASRDGLDVEASYKQYWARFDEEFWREEVKQGRLTRPRSDLFMQHFLSSRQGQDIPIKHLYIEYRHWIESEKPFPDVATELKTLARQGDQFRRIIAPEKSDEIYGLCTFLEAYDIRTAYPLLLALLDANLEATEWQAISEILESYLLRRAVCNLGTKNYNRIFLGLTRNLRRDGFSAAKLKALLLAQTGESGVWPDDATFREAWVSKQLYGPLNSPKLVHLFSRLNQTFMSSKSEAVVFGTQPTVEHIMPQTWTKTWPLPDGGQGMDFTELYSASPADPRVTATRKREVAIQTLGNLTILSSGLNTSQSNQSWDKKRPEMMKHSLLPINQSLLEMSVWDESTVQTRGEQLFERALSVWER
ncbi:DUF262 domain-containing protein [Mesorhizobium sp. SARCC-RB16n]|uniref:DUF262 domain-containing protein n=1 Tax=Mesorhizobium sp. SARCC-RB16n TaxID=2116687 RepID=UPI00122FAC56|nr:DUF262 domain-containing protein [Mesorhizobium sp. SARCC-RB16n]KAA3448617.1 DUF262 domain-containing protein [Mesorhizobium sp. SARCC-RB16n]